MTVYVGQFGGFATEDSLLKKASELAGAAKVGRPSAMVQCPLFVVQGANAASVDPMAHNIADHCLLICELHMIRPLTFGTSCSQADGVELNTDGLIW